MSPFIFSLFFFVPESNVRKKLHEMVVDMSQSICTFINSDFTKQEIRVIFETMVQKINLTKPKFKWKKQVIFFKCEKNVFSKNNL